MLNDEVIELLTERLVNRIEEGNTYILKTIAENVSKLGTLSPSKAQQLVQILKYGGSYEKIAKKLAGLLNLNVRDIYDIFEEVAKRDKDFAKQFYKYRNQDFIPYKKDLALQNQVKALARQTAETYINMSRTSAIGFSVKDLSGRTIFKGIQQAYYDAIDTAMLNVGQGKETFDNAMSKIIKELGNSGIKTIDYASGRSRRLDSAVRMNMQEALRDMHNNLQEQFGNEYGADGLEISVHLNPADDHETAQGHQFSQNEWFNLQNTGIAKDYEGNSINIHQPLKTGLAPYFRPISTMNCYHYIFSIILGVNKPAYSSKELQEIINKNNKGFEFEGKHYSMYEGQQLQRRLETEIRKQKDIQIMARASQNEIIANKSQQKINILTSKYEQLNEISGLKPKLDRLKVSGYHKIKVSENTLTKANVVKTPAINIPVISNEEKYNKLIDNLSNKKVTINSKTNDFDRELFIKNLEQLNYLTDKYPHNKYFKQELYIVPKSYTDKTFGDASYKEHRIGLTNTYFKDKTKLFEEEKKCIKQGWHQAIPDEKVELYTITHEYGHLVEYNYLKKIRDIRINSGRSFDFKATDKDLQDLLLGNAIKGTGLTKTEFKEKYFSGYAKSKRNYEWFAETFTQMELGEETPITKALKEWLEKFYE